MLDGLPEVLNNCSCTAYSYGGSQGCLVWQDGLLNAKQPQSNGGDSVSDVETLYLRLAAREFQTSGGGRKRGVIVGAVAGACTAALVLLVLATALIIRRRKKTKNDDRGAAAGGGLTAFHTESCVPRPRISPKSSGKVASAPSSRGSCATPPPSR